MTPRGPGSRFKSADLENLCTDLRGCAWIICSLVQDNTKEAVTVRKWCKKWRHVKMEDKTVLCENGRQNRFMCLWKNSWKNPRLAVCVRARVCLLILLKDSMENFTGILLCWTGKKDLALLLVLWSCYGSYPYLFSFRHPAALKCF